MRRYCSGPVALQRDLAIIVGIVQGCRDGFAALHGVSAMVPFNAKHCKFSVFGQSGGSCLGFGGKQHT